MTVTTTWAGLGYQDAASLVVDGVYYRLYTYLNLDNESVEGVLKIEQTNGQDVLVERRTIYQATIGSSRLRPRCIACGSQFLVMWTFAGELHKLRVDPATNSWASLGILSGHHADELYDVHSLRQGFSHILVYKNLSGTLNVRRYNALGWSADWQITLGETPINCLGCYGDSADDIVFAAYQINDGDGRQRLRIAHWNATTGSAIDAGGGSAARYAFVDAPLEDVNWSRLGICKINSSVIALVAEGKIVETPAILFEDRIVAYCSFIQNGLAQNSNEHYVHNLSMQSRPWGYMGEGGQDNDVYCVLGFKETFTAGHAKWAQHFAYVCNMDAVNWSEANFTVRPYSSCNLTLNTIDSRPGWLTSSVDYQNFNHLPSTCDPVPYGPNTKTRTVPLIEFGRTGIRAGQGNPIRSEVVPINATVTGFKFNHEDTWTYYRDGLGPAQPPNNAENYLGPNPAPMFRNIEIGDSMFIGGGNPATYDGKQIVEMGFHWAPEIMLENAADFGASAGIENGKYFWTAVYEWRDTAGQLHRSAPAEPFYRELTSGSPNNAVTLRVRTITLSLKEGYRYPDSPAVEIVLYRTEDNGSIFYRVYGADGTAGWSSGTIENTPKNDPTVAYVSIIDRQDNDRLNNSEPLPYQLAAGGGWKPIANWPPPAAAAFTSWNNRLWYASSEDRAQIWYSKAVLPENGGVRYAVPEMSPFLTYRLDDGEGPITGMQAMDYGLVVFKRKHIFILNGEPADDAGAGSTLDHQTIAVGTGCVDPRSIVLTPAGVFFQAEKGYYLLDRSQNMDYVSAGGSVEDLFRMAGNIHSAELIPNRHQVRIVMNETVTGKLFDDNLTNGGRYVLLYDYLMKAWSRIDMQQANSDGWRSTLVASRVWRGLEGENLHVVLAQGGIFIERDRGQNDTYNDQDHDTAVVPIPIDIRTGWIKDGLSRSSRVREIVIEADKPNDSLVSVDIDYEVNGTWDDTLTDTFTWNSPAPTTMRIRPRVQKLTAFRVRLYEPTVGLPATENIKLQSISYVVGHRGKTRKIPDAKIGL